VLDQILGPSVEAFQTPQRGGDLAIVQPQRQEAAVVIGGIAERGRVPFQPHPLGLERRFGHSQHQHARPLQSLLDRRDDVFAIDDTVAYIENQAEHHRKKTFKEELEAILKMHAMDYEGWMLD
jgi:hypothetical protein